MGMGTARLGEVSMQATEKIWMDGTFVDWDNAQVHVLSHTLHYGLGAFEGIRCYDTAHGPAVFRLPEHLDRLFDSVHIAGLTMPYTKDEIRRAIIDTVKINNVRECYIRPLVYLGYGEMGINNSHNPVCVAIAVWPWGAYLGEKALTEGIRRLPAAQAVLIEGHTDATGPEPYNERLSERRAQAVKGYLVARHGIDAARLRAVGRGERAPLPGRDGEAPENRRVQFRGE